MELSISIVNFNIRDLLYNCLLSIFKTGQNLSFEVIVVDNNSQDNSAEMVLREFPQVRLVRNKSNLGFSRANNQAIKMSRGRNILLLNNDTVVLKDNLHKMVTFLKLHQDVAIVGPQILSSQGKPCRSCFKFPNLREHLLSRQFLKKVIDQSPFSLAYSDWNSGKTKEVDWVSGACLMIKKEVLEQIGLLDERLFMHFEDVDLCLRARKAGFKVFYLPQASIIHIGQCSTRKDSQRCEIEWHRARLIYFKKHHSYLVFTLTRFLMLGGSILRLTSLLFRLLLTPQRYRNIKDKLNTNFQILKIGLR